MLNPNFKNGTKTDVQSALAVFVIIMGFLFLIDAAPGVHSAVAIATIVFGFFWYFGHQAYIWWGHTHHH